MAYAFSGDASLDYFPCRYGDSRVLMRGPYRPPRDDYCVTLGGAETYGRLVARPWPDLLEQATGRMMINLGLPNSGPDLYLNDAALLAVAGNAGAAILQLPGMVNLTNQYYSVHPRRNDRVLQVLPPLRALYPDVDFIEFNFTNHLVLRLRSVDPDRFEVVRQDLRKTWLQRMRTLRAQLPARQILLQLDSPAAGYDAFPFVDRSMIDAIGAGAEVIEVTRSDTSEPSLDDPGTGAAFHHRIAATLALLIQSGRETQTGARRRP